MLDWLNTLPKPEPEAPPEPGQDSGVIQGSPVFPVSRFRDGLPGNAKRPANPLGYAVFPVSRFSRFENGGYPEKDPDAGNDCEEKGGGIPEHLPDLLDAMADRLDPAEVDELRSMAQDNPEQAAVVCRLILAAPAFPTEADVAELDRLIVRLCELEPWLPGFQADMLAARLRMAPAHVHIDLARFRQWVREAEARARGRRGGGGMGNLSAPSRRYPS